MRRIYALEGVFDGPGVETVSPREMERLSLLKTPSNSLATVEIPRYRLDAERLGDRLALALDEVQNPGNLGTIIRLADWFGIGEIVCSPGSADCFNPKVVQATMGAILRVRVHYAELAPLLARAAGRGTPVYGTFLEGENIHTARIDGRRGIVVMGNEGPRRHRRRGAHRHAQTLHPALPRRPPQARIAQRGDGHGHRLRRVPPTGRGQRLKRPQTSAPRPKEDTARGKGRGPDAGERTRNAEKPNFSRKYPRGYWLF